MFVSIRGIQIEEQCWFILFTSWLLTHLIYKLGIQFYKSMHSGCSVFATPVVNHFIVCLPIICYSRCLSFATPVAYLVMVHLFIICYSHCPSVASSVTRYPLSIFVFSLFCHSPLIVKPIIQVAVSDSCFLHYIYIKHALHV